MIGRVVCVRVACWESSISTFLPTYHVEVLVNCGGEGRVGGGGDSPWLLSVEKTGCVASLAKRLACWSPHVWLFDPARPDWART